MQATCRLTAVTLIAGSLYHATPALARPQANSSLLGALCEHGTRSDPFGGLCFYGAARADLVLLRDSPRDFGVGPYASVGTRAFDDLRLGTGATTHLPIDDAFPILVSVGAYARYRGSSWHPGVAGQLFFGSRSYNYRANYVLSGGLVAGLDYGLGRNREVISFIGAQLDSFFLAAPFILLYQALRN